MTRDRGELPPRGGGRDCDESDENLMLRVGRGEKGAFDEIVRRYASKMINLAYRITGDRELAEDIGQETFLRAYRSAARYREISKFSTWLHTIAINLCRNELRRRKFRMYSLEAMAEKDEDSKIRIDIADEKGTPDREVERRELGRMIKKAVDTLPEKFKTPLVLRDMQGLTYEEIGGILDLPEGTVKSRINRARLRVKELLEPMLRDDYPGGSTV
jgi:RNA polymerase sigma-70 factor (ECF subfamily)